MIQHEMHHDKGVPIVKPLEPLAKEDFAAIARDADGYIESHGALNGLMICAKRFPGYKNAQGLWSHLRFVRGHHRNIKKVAFVSDFPFFKIASRLVGRCVQPNVKHFGYQHEDSAMNWLGMS
jgi:hypothetical protein